MRETFSGQTSVALSGNAVVKNRPGRLCKVCITSVSAQFVVTDNSSIPGGQIVYSSGGQNQGTVLDLGIPCRTGIAIQFVNGTYTVSYS